MASVRRVQSVVRGYHVNKHEWKPELGSTIETELNTSTNTIGMQ